MPCAHSFFAFAKQSLVGLMIAMAVVVASSGQAAANDAGSRTARLSVSVTVKTQCAISTGAQQEVALDCYGGGPAPVVTSAPASDASGTFEVATILF